MNDVVFAEGAEEISLYGGAVALYFDPDMHVYYTIDEATGEHQTVAGVTTVCGMMDKSGALTQWAANSTVEWVLENIPVEAVEVREQLHMIYRYVKEKTPLPTGQMSLISIDTPSLVKLLNDARFNYRKISKDATDIGTLAHNWLEQHVKALIGGTVWSGPLPDSPKAQNCIKAALDWMKIHMFKPMYSERKIFSKMHGFAGTLDWIGEVTSCGNPACCPFHGTVTELGDFKSSKAIYDEYFIQTAAYEFAILEEIENITIDHRRILRLGKEDGEFETQICGPETFEMDLLAFLGMLQAFNWRQQRDLDLKHAKAEAKAVKAAAKKSSAKVTSIKRTKIKKQVYEPIPVAS